MGMICVIRRRIIEFEDTVDGVEWNRRPPVLTLNLVYLNFDLGVNKTRD